MNHGTVFTKERSLDQLNFACEQFERLSLRLEADASQATNCWFHSTTKGLAMRPLFQLQAVASRATNCCFDSETEGQFMRPSLKLEEVASPSTNCRSVESSVIHTLWNDGRAASLMGRSPNVERRQVSVEIPQTCRGADKRGRKHRLLISLTVRDPQRSLARQSSGRTYSAADTDTRDGVRQERDGVAGGVKLPNSP